MIRTTSALRRLLREEDGASLLEYGILVLLIAALSIAALKVFGSRISGQFAAADQAIP